MKRFTVLFLLLFLFSCRSSKVIRRQFTKPPAYTLIYIIHGDSNYLYHTENGKGLQADKQALKTALSVAVTAKNGRVLIFYQKPEQKILWIFPRKDRQFYLYRNGKLILKKKYSPRSKTIPFSTEAKLYHKYADASTRNKIFLYFGHEIPVRKTRIYNFSRPDVPLTTALFAKGVALFTDQGRSPFKLTVLSTCNNGTPSMVQAISPYTRYVLASPQNLHLSYMDSGRLSSLLERQRSMEAIADSMAVHTYKRLSSFLQTAITLSIYDTHRAKSYLPALSHKYTAYLKGVSTEKLLKDNTDCKQLPFFNLSADTAGVKEWYNPPRFGRKTKASKKYSGWGCK